MTIRDLLAFAKERNWPKAIIVSKPDLADFVARLNPENRGDDPELWVSFRIPSGHGYGDATGHEIVVTLSHPEKQAIQADRVLFETERAGKVIYEEEDVVS